MSRIGGLRSRAGATLAIAIELMISRAMGSIRALDEKRIARHGASVLQLAAKSPHPFVGVKAGVSRDELVRWLKRGEREENGVFADFYRGWCEACDRFRSALRADIERAAASGDSEAEAWLRSNPE